MNTITGTVFIFKINFLDEKYYLDNLRIISGLFMNYLYFKENILSYSYF